MATREILVSDLSGTEGTVVTETLYVDGQWLTIDLTDLERDTLMSVLEPYISASRVTLHPAPLRRPRPSGLTAPERVRIRNWAKNAGVACPERGRVPNRVVAAFGVAHPDFKPEKADTVVS